MWLLRQRPRLDRQHAPTPPAQSRRRLSSEASCALCFSSAEDAAEGPSKDDLNPLGGLGDLGGRELTRVVAEAADPKTTSVGDVYSRDLISVEPAKDLEEALQLMARHQVRRLPVVDNGRLVGIVAQADIALRENEKKTGELVQAISVPSDGERK
jgi:signal-transduction protein with cAMP-binding, CBS, and nucleotidyltransferase domain